MWGRRRSKNSPSPDYESALNHMYSEALTQDVAEDTWRLE
jgi:hypothetical protein